MEQNSSHIITSKEEIKNLYENFIGKLQNTYNRIAEVRAQNSKLKSVQNEFLDKLSELIQKSTKQMKDALDGTVWDKLVIAFFGETNAGKSTIIECCRILFHDPEREKELTAHPDEGVDGLIVGDGRTDYTKDYHEYNLKINGKDFILIDVPGIEGNENEFQEEIRNALKQAHCVLYIQGHNKKPDSATALKIQKYLSEWVDVYSVYNVRGGASDYDEDDERETLITERVKQTEISISEVFNDSLVGVYRGGITCQAFLALNAIANFHNSRNDLISNQEKVVRYFSTPKSVWEFSRFDELVKVIETQSNDFQINIIGANKHKLQSLSHGIEHSITEVINGHQKEIDNLSNQLISFKHDIITSFNNTSNSIKRHVRSEVRLALDRVISTVNEIIDYSNTKKEAEIKSAAVIDEINEELNQQLSNIITEQKSALQTNIDHKKKDLDQVLISSLEDIDFNIKLDLPLDNILSDLGFNFIKDGIKKAIGSILTGFGLTSGGAAIGGLIGGPPGAIIGGLVGGIAAMISAFRKTDDGRSKAKQKVKESVDKCSNIISQKLEPKLQMISDSLARQKKQQVNSLDKEMKNLSSLQDSISMLKTELYN